MDFSKTRQHYRMATGQGLDATPPKSDIDARAGRSENAKDHIHQVDDEGDRTSTNLGTPLLRGRY
jgi:hypothetical protein